MRFDLELELETCTVDIGYQQLAIGADSDTCALLWVMAQGFQFAGRLIADRVSVGSQRNNDRQAHDPVPAGGLTGRHAAAFVEIGQEDPAAPVVEQRAR